MNNKLGIAISHAGSSHMSFCMLKEINMWLKERFDKDIIVFYETLSQPCMPFQCASMQINEAYGFDGPLIATTFSTAAKMLQFPSTKRKFFYVWDLEWYHSDYKVYEELMHIYGNRAIKLIARSLDHATILSHCWNVPVPPIVEDFDLKKLIEITDEVNTH